MKNVKICVGDFIEFKSRNYPLEGRPTEIVCKGVVIGLRTGLWGGETFKVFTFSPKAEMRDCIQSDILAKLELPDGKSVPRLNDIIAISGRLFWVGEWNSSSKERTIHDMVLSYSSYNVKNLSRFTTKILNKKDLVTTINKYLIGYQITANSGFHDFRCAYGDMRRNKQENQRGVTYTRPLSGLPFDAEMNGKVHSKGSFFLDMQRHIKEEGLIRPRYKSKDNYVGVELECMTDASHDELKKALKLEGLHLHTRVEHDGSIEEHHGKCGCEIKVLGTENEIKDILTRVCAVLQDNGGEVNNSCGLHVHLDMRHRDAELCYKKLFNSLEFVHRMMPSHRQNGYNKMNEYGTLKESIAHEARQTYLNAHALEKHNTLEMRCHEASIDADEIMDWINFLKIIIDTFPKTKHQSLPTFLNKIESEEIKSYVQNRVKNCVNASYKDCPAEPDEYYEDEYDDDDCEEEEYFDDDDN